MKSFAAPLGEPTGSTSDISFLPLKPRQWRVVDNRLPAHDVRALLGFLEKVNDRYELTLIGHPGDRRTFDDLDAVRHTVHSSTQATTPAEGHWSHLARPNHTR